MAIVYLVDRGEPENADFFAGRSNGFRVWMERSSVEWAERTAREFSEVDLYLVERYKDGWVLRSLRSATPFEGHARRMDAYHYALAAASERRSRSMSPRLRGTFGMLKAPKTTFPVGARVLVDGRDEVRVTQAFPEGSSSHLFPHYRVDFKGGDRNVAVSMKRIGVERKR